MPNAFTTANKLRRYAPIIAHNHVNLKPRHNADTGSGFFVYADKSHKGPATCHFQLLDAAVMAAPMD